MEKYAVQLDEDLTKTATKDKKRHCPKCGSALEASSSIPKCPSCGTEEFEKKGHNKD